MAEKKTINRLFDLMILGLATASCLGLFGRLHWFFDLFAHFRVQYMQLCLPLIAITLWKRLHKRSVMLILLASINYSVVLPFYFGRPEAPKNKPLRAMLINLLSSNGNTELVLERIKEAAPNLLLLEEVTPEWERQLAALNKTFPYRLSAPRSDNFGIMLLADRPLERGKIIYPGPAQVPTVSAELHLPEGIIHFIGTHPLPPAGKTYSENRNAQLMELGKLAESLDGHVILMGDLNCTPWSPWFAALRETSGLQNSMKGFGFQPTWPAGNPFMRIPLDHLLHSENIKIHQRVVGKELGSDHLPLIVDLYIDTPK